MDNDLKSGLGYIIPVGAIIGFVLALITENFNLAMIMAVTGILGWFIYLLIMEIKPPRPFGNIVVFFGVLLSLAVFLATGLEQDMFGGYILRSQGLIYAVIVLFFSILTGVLFRSMSQKQDKTIDSQLSQSDRDLVEKAISQEAGAETEPRIIVLKQEIPSSDKEEESEQEYDYGEYDPYAYSYPPEYYEDEDEEDDDEEYEDENEDEEDEQ